MLADPIASLESPNGSLVSLYVDRPSPGGLSALITDLLKPVREAAEERGRPVEKSVAADVRRIRELTDRMEAETAPSYAIFASNADGIFMVEALTHSVPNASDLGPRPYLRPLRAAPRPFRAGVLVADRALARIFVLAGDLVEEVGDPIRADLGKSNYGGFTGYEEYTVRRRSEEETHKMWREASDRLMSVHRDRALDFLAIGTHDETVEDIARMLHPYLAALYRAPFVATPQTITVPMLRAELADIASSVRRRRQSAVAGRVCDTAWSGGLAVLGLQPTIEAANVQAIDVLVVAGSFTRTGTICNVCGHLSRLMGACPVCGNQVFAVDDLVSAIMDATVASGGHVHQVSVASPLDVEGIGALTRFPLPSG